jgi:hypothetical protein
LYSSNFGVSTKLTKDIPHFSFSTAHHSNQSLGAQFGEIILRRNTPSKSRPARLGYLKQARLVKKFKKRLGELVEITPAMQWPETLPGIGVILSATIALEVGDIGRFLSAERLASYSGTVPRVHSSGDRTRYGRTRPDVNRYLKWAFAEAANSIAVNYRRCPDRT